MKILHVIQTLSPRHGGPRTALISLAHHQAGAGHEVCICTTDQSYKNRDEKASVFDKHEKSIDAVTIWRYHAYFKPLLISSGLAACLRREIANFDIVHIHGLYRFPVTYAAMCARKKGVPYIIRPHGSLDPFLYRQSRFGRTAVPLKRAYERIFDFPNLHNAAAIHYTAQEEAERAAVLKIRAKSVVVPIGINWDDYEDLPQKGYFRSILDLDEATPLVLFLGRINFKKGFDLLIPAFRNVLDEFPQAQLIIVGPDNEGYGAKVRRWCKKYSIDDKVLFVDHIDADDVKKAYIDADVFVLPSYTENFGMTVVEAMACGCPVVISDQVNIWREVKNTNAGMVVSLNPDHICEAILHLLRNRAEAVAMGQQGRRVAKDAYSWSRIVNVLTDVYQEIIEESAAKKRLNQ